MGIKYKVNEDFFKTWSQEMAYVLGYLYADGSMEDASYLRGKYVRVSSVERNNIVKIRKWIGSEHTIVPQKSLHKNGRTGYLLRIGSHAIYNDLLKLGLYPNKSLTITLPNIPKEYFEHFVRGYFDGDGCVRLATHRGILKKLSTVFTCGSRIFLEKLAIKIHKYIDTDQTNIYNGHRSFMLSYSSSDSVRLFKFMYHGARKDVFLKRKFDRYKEYFSLRPARVDKEVKSILESTR